MAKKLNDGRKPGSGLSRYSLSPDKELQKKIGKYKVYYLYDKLEPEIPRYIGLTKQWLCKRLSYHIYTTFNKEQGSDRDKWIKDIGRKRVGIEMIELLPIETTKYEAFEIENYYINKHKDTITNMLVNKFGETIQMRKDKKIKKEVVDQIVSMYKKGMKLVKIAELLNINSHIVHYWVKKKKINKKQTFEKDVLSIKEYLLYNKFPGYKIMSDILGIKQNRLKYIIQKNK